MIGSIAVRTLLFGWELWSALQALNDPSSLIHRSERTIRILLPWLTPARVVLFGVATLCCVAAIDCERRHFNARHDVALAATFASQILERFSFFTAVTAPRMPGGV